MRQQQDPRPLGAILLDMGLVKEEELLQVLGVQLFLSTREIDPYEVPLELLSMLPREVAIHNALFPMEITRAGRLVVATAEVPSRDRLDQLEQRLGRPWISVLTTRQQPCLRYPARLPTPGGGRGRGEDLSLGQILLEPAAHHPGAIA